MRTRDDDGTVSDLGRSTMTAAVALDTAHTAAPATDTAVGLVAVADFGFARYRAACSCGWAGRRRRLRAAAQQDAWLHAIHQSCEVAVPLVRPTR
ncbi:hypothetical protein MPHLEI_00617 [Mycolicibacterium phlei RIVM601174]|nr:hypothetical protein MPHLEI_00617 [Mycolicibacterium phlei RIVM601174]MBF4194146.1 hypothetical protein [Mycolicibacterium phlei]